VIDSVAADIDALSDLRALSGSLTATFSASLRPN
jgi:hypothetical protein